MKLITKGSIFTLAMVMLGCQTMPAITPTDANTLQAEAFAAVSKFKSETSGADTLLRHAKGVLVCPKITKGGFIVGVEGGKCVMQVGGKPVEYYSNRAGKFGLLAGVQWYSLILAFNDQAALDTFRTGNREWEIGADASVAIAKVGAGGSLDTTNLKQAIVAFTFGQKGLMADVSLEGAAFRELAVAR